MITIVCTELTLSIRLLLTVSMPAELAFLLLFSTFSAYSFRNNFFNQYNFRHSAIAGAFLFSAQKLIFQSSLRGAAEIPQVRYSDNSRQNLTVCL
jgi:hypothetical protein